MDKIVYYIMNAGLLVLLSCLFIVFPIITIITFLSVHKPMVALLIVTIQWIIAIIVCAFYMFIKSIGKMYDV